jgi:hypothetical protein
MLAQRGGGTWRGSASQFERRVLRAKGGLHFSPGYERFIFESSPAFVAFQGDVPPGFPEIDPARVGPLGGLIFSAPQRGQRDFQHSKLLREPAYGRASFVWANEVRSSATTKSCSFKLLEEADCQTGWPGGPRAAGNGTALGR